MPSKRVTCSKYYSYDHLVFQCIINTVVTTSVVINGSTLLLEAFNAKQKQVWPTKLKVNGKEVHLKLETVAEMTAISSNLCKITSDIQAQAPSKMLYRPAQQ